MILANKNKIFQMIDYNKISEYATTMILKSGSGLRLTDMAFCELCGASNQNISETELHDGIEYLIAKKKTEVESNSNATTQQKDLEKNLWEITLKFLEEQIKAYLKSQNRLI